MQSTTSPRLTQALAYAAAGIPVFPCIPGSKRPAIAGSFHAATTDPLIILNWFETIGDCNIGVCPEAMNCCVIDPDGDEGRAWEGLADLPPTRTVATPSDGLHLYFEGSLAASASRLAPHVDVRGRGSYVLVPPSVVDGRPYRLVSNDPIAPLPAWVGERLAQREHAHLTAPDGVELDQPWNIEQAEAYLARAEPWGMDDPADTYVIAAAAKDYGLSPEKLVNLMMVPLGEDERDWLTKTVENVYGYGQNEPGSRGLPDPAVWKVEQYAPPPPDELEQATIKSKRRFAGRTPSEDARQPPLEYWDADNTLPHIPGGCAGLAYGPRSSHKTGLVLKKFADAAFNRSARVLYIAAEGAHGIGKMRLPRVCEQRGRRIEDLDECWRTISTAPNLLSERDLAELIEEYHDFNPDLIAVDTVTRAAPGADINSPMVGVGIVLGMETLATAFNALVLGITHPGKDASRGAIGSKLVEDLSFFVWQLSHEAGVVRAYIDKMKDGPAEFTVPYRVMAGGVPVVVDCSAEERAVLLKGGPTHDELRDTVYKRVFDRVVAGETFTINNSGFGSRVLAADLEVEEKHVKSALDQLVARGRLKLMPGHGYQLPDGARAPDSF